MKLRVLHLEDNPDDVELVRSTLCRQGVECDIVAVNSGTAFISALQHAQFDVILSDSGVPGYSGGAALSAARERDPAVPFIVVSANPDLTPRRPELPAGGTVAYVAKSELDRLAPTLRRIVPMQLPALHPGPKPSHLQGLQLLVSVVQRLSFARTLQSITGIVRHAARELVNADGATFVLREGELCFYADENAIAPLWKGQRFPLQACVSGWVMLNRQPAIIEDIYRDARVPHDAYRPTFVKSLVMMPIRTVAPIGAIGVYWAHRYRAAPEEVELLQALADSTSIAIEAADLFANLERRVAERTAELDRRTAELEVLNRELEAFSYSVAHDLRAPLITIDGFSQVLLESSADRLDEMGRDHLDRISGGVRRMHRLINDLLELSKIARTPMQRTIVDLSQLARDVLQTLQNSTPSRETELALTECLTVEGDAGLLRIVLENLLSNAWKFTSHQARARIEFGTRTDRGGNSVYYVRDDGVGFDPRYAAKLFNPFQRLHSQTQFPGNGIGLATVQRIIHRHGGEVWAESDGEHGACFYFTLPY